MQKPLESFKLNINGKVLDYRLGKRLNLEEVTDFFVKKYLIKKLWSDQRHVLGILKKDNTEFLLKLATSEGISVVTQIEFNWNEEFNKLVSRETSSFWVPKNIDSGYYQNNLFYLITDKFSGELLSPDPHPVDSYEDLQTYIPKIIEFSETIQSLKIPLLTDQENPDYQQWFIKKTEAWFKDIPEEVREKYKVNELLEIVKRGAVNLAKRPRHGDFTSWHIFKLHNGKLGLIDGEHAKANGVQYYDICYFIQRVCCVLENPDLAKKIFSLLLERKFDSKKLQTVLAARTIGGFLDESLKESPDYALCESFKEWIEGI